MTNNGRVIKTYEDYRRLSADQKEFWQFEQLSKINTFRNQFASKWVERAMYGVISIVAFFILNQVLQNTFTVLAN